MKLICSFSPPQEAFNILHSVQDEVTLRIFKFAQCPLELQNYLLPKDESASFELSADFREANIFESTRISELDDEQSNEKSNTNKVSGIRKVILIKQDGSLGFTLSKIENEGFYVKQVLREPASLEAIHPGDRILSVNGTSLDGLGLNDAIKLLRSLPDLCEFKLEQPCDSLTANCEDQTDSSLNYQSEPEDDSRFAKKPLRHEVKIMLDSRNRDPLHNRLKRKDLKKSKDESTKEQKSERSNLESNRESSRESGCCLDSGLNDSRPCSDRFGDISRLSDGRSRESRFDIKPDSRLNRLDNRSESKLDNRLESKLDSRLDSRLESKLNKENNFDAFMKVNSRSQLTGESAFYRQSSVMDYESRGEQRSKQNNLNNLSVGLNKWRNQNTMLLSGSDEREEEDEDHQICSDSGCLTKSASLAFSASTNLNLNSTLNSTFNSTLNSIINSNLNSNLNSAFKKTTLKELNTKELNADEANSSADSISGRSPNRTAGRQANQSRFLWTNSDDPQRAADRATDRTTDRAIDRTVDRPTEAYDQSVSHVDAIQLSDIQLKLKLTNDCLLNENSMYKQIENGLFFYVTLDRIGWHGRLGFSLADDQINDFRVVNTLKHGFSACLVREVYPNSLAYTDGRIRVADKLLEVNNQQLINKPVQTVIRDLRKLKGKLRLLFIRKVF